MESKGSSKRHQEALLGRYVLGGLLGQGTFAKVYYARSVADGSPVAIKVLDKPDLSGKDMAHSVLREVAAMRRLSHPNILKLYEVMATRSKIFLVMEHAPGGDLLARVARSGRLPEPAARRYFQQLVSAMNYCHAHGITHRDVKPQNLLLDSEGDLKVSDFGLSALPEQIKEDCRLHTACGTPAYTAPEVMRRKGYDGAKADAWSCGVILFVLLAGALPFDDANIALMYRKIHKRDYAFPPWVSQSARKMVFRLLDPNPETRLTIKAVMDYPWFKRSLSLDSHLSFIAAPWQTPTAIADFSSSTREINAFSIISSSSGLDLSGLFAKKKKEKRFTSNEPAENIIQKIGDAGTKLGYTVEIRKGGRVTEVAKWGSTMKVEIYGLSPPLVLVEMKVETVEGGGGAAGSSDDGSEGFSWEEVQAELGDMVVAWDSSSTESDGDVDL